MTEGDSVNFTLTRSLPDGKTSPHMSGALNIRVKIKEQFRDSDGNYSERVVDPEDQSDPGHLVTFGAGENTKDFTWTSADDDQDGPDRTLALIVMRDKTASSTKRERWSRTVHNEVWFEVLETRSPP